MQNTTLILGLNPTWQRLFITEDLVLGKIHRLPKPVEFASGKGINCGRVLDLLGGKPILLHFLGGANGRFIPLLDMREKWTNERLCEYYNVSEEEFKMCLEWFKS